jgi:hypothetical protein
MVSLSNFSLNRDWEVNKNDYHQQNFRWPAESQGYLHQLERQGQRGIEIREASKRHIGENPGQLL